VSSADRHERVGELLVAALEQPSEERERFLQEACREDDLLRKEVQALLESHDAAGDFLEVPILQAMRWNRQRGMEGRRVGPYRLLREIGRGGMGVVYAAARSDEAFQKKVAVKLVKRGMDTEEIVRRFENERRILAGLDHPNIARILDGGTTEEGLPYFVMEYVEGLPILEFCDSRELSTNERLKLFGSVCSAVAFAHQNLVVHRDLKPSNILVDSTGVVRLLDFGIAKLLARAEETTKTTTGLRPMTPWYSSPEQIRGESISTASDVYSLGVLLYELLAGRPPYRIASRAPSEVERAVCEEEPERPSAAVGRREQILRPERSPLGVDADSLSVTRDEDPKRLRRRLAGDLDNIVLLALRKDPRRRYASVEQLSEDIRRHLSGLPIRARKDTFLYRGGKFLRRHAFGVAAAVAFALLAVGATAVLAIQRSRIERERLKAAQVSEFLTDLFKGSDPRVARGASLTVREMLDRGGERIQRDLAGQPEVQAMLLDTIGRIYSELGLLEPANTMIENAYRTRRRLFGDKSLPVAESLQSLGELAVARGEFAKAEARLREALSLRRQFLGEKHLAVAETLRSLGKLLRRTGDDAAAERVLRRALSIQTSLVGEKGLVVADTWNSLGVTLGSRGQYGEAEQALRKAIEITRSTDRDHPNVTKYLNNLGLVLIAKGSFHEATLLYRESSERHRRLVGDNHPYYAAGLANLSAALDLDGRTEEAEELARKSLAIGRRAVGDDHPDLALGWDNLATILRGKGDADGAQEAAQQALRIIRAKLPDHHPQLAAPLLNLGWALNVKKQPAEAEPLLRKALEILSGHLKPGDWRIAEAESLLGACLSSQGHFDEASSLLTKSYGVQKVTLGAQHRQTVETLQQLVSLYDAWRNPERARFYRRELESARSAETTAASLSVAKN
jgi:serine/threonine protein kinase/Flp pilus assembly protein TadD